VKRSVARRTMRRGVNSGVILMLVLLGVGGGRLGQAQVLETETARFLPAGTWELGTAFEFQKSSEGTERAVPIAAEYGITNRVAFLAEPVPYTAIRPKTGPSATGAGDLELTALALARGERSRFPAIAFAIEVKVPTSESLLIGTDQTDFTGYIIGSKRLGRLDTHFNLTYTIPGQPPDTHLNNTVGAAIAGEYSLSRTVELFGEVLGTTSSSAEGGDNPTNVGTVIPEASGGELVGSMGFAVHPSPVFEASLGVSYDNNQAVLIRPSVTYWWSK
jgi:hypothetical protein